MSRRVCHEMGLVPRASYLWMGFPGLGVAALGGHSPGSTLFAIAVGGHLWILSGDIANSKADLVSDTGKGFLYSYVMVPENTGRTGDVAWMADWTRR